MEGQQAGRAGSARPRWPAGRTTNRGGDPPGDLPSGRPPARLLVLPPGVADRRAGGGRAWGWLPRGLALAALGSAVVLLGWDGLAGPAATGAHRVLSALPLLLIATAALAWQARQRAGRATLVKTVILAAGFGCWATGQLVSAAGPSAVCNDLAIGLFVLDAALVVADQQRRAHTADRELARALPGAGHDERGD